MSYLEEMRHLKDLGTMTFDGDYLLMVDEQSSLNRISLPIERGGEWRVHIGYATGQEGVMAYCEDVDWAELEHVGDLECESVVNLIAVEDPSTRVLKSDKAFALELDSFHRPLSVYVIKRQQTIVAFYIETVDEGLTELPIGEFSTDSSNLCFTDPANTDESLIVPVTPNLTWTVTGFLDETETLVRVEGRAQTDSLSDVTDYQELGTFLVLSAFICVLDEQQLNMTPHPITVDYPGSPFYLSLMSLMGENQEAAWNQGVIFLTEGGNKEYSVRGSFQENRLVTFSIDLFEDDSIDLGIKE
ncbi:hypothetical protein [Exiguobacterium sp. SL-9]|uniref:hypothetical protein n=1 Tax=Exiguobacterium sp. SL-9 TaxID=2510963 RepID=UPI00103F5F54|nr:hypothetical protein [Exiguobacterium sp. SL-9]TCI22943.1 hypothetical protein EVJ34_00565 [Exiguobacterium sp. SL-9]